eukprot:4750903-Pyramimonas_sp.AAC.1
MCNTAPVYTTVLACTAAPVHNTAPVYTTESATLLRIPIRTLMRIPMRAAAMNGAHWGGRGVTL